MAGMPHVEITITHTPESTVYSLPAPATSMQFLILLDSLDLKAGEKRMIEHALAITAGNKSKAAKLLGLHVRSLRRKLNSKRKTAARDERQLSLV